MHIWKDKWIPTSVSFKVVSPRGSSNNVEWVSNLIDTETRSWDTTKVNSTFLPFEAQVILGIPINPQLLIDSLIWAWTPNGCFTVKSAYKVA